MKRVLGVMAFVAMALVPFSGVAAQGPASPSGGAPRGAVLGVSVTPATGRADVMIAVDGTADVMDFKLDGGKRIVMDFSGVTLGRSFATYDKVSRAGITNIRYSQYRADVVRIVLDLDTPREYTVLKGEHDVRISVTGPDAFAPWHAGSGAKSTVTGVSLGAVAAQLTDASPGALGKNFEEARRAPAVTAPAKFLPAKLTPEPSYAEPRITITLNDVHIRDVIERFAEFGGRTIVVGRTVDGFVNATIKDQPWDVALRQILTAQGLSALEDSTGIISVDSYTNLADRAKVEPTATHIITVNYAKAETMANTVRSLLTAGCSSAPANAPVGAPSPVAQAQVAQCASRGSVAFDEKTNTVIVTEIPSRLAEIESYVHDLDVRTPQVTKIGRAHV
jgi:type IV pilus assembly protein PilQ